MFRWFRSMRELLFLDLADLGKGELRYFLKGSLVNFKRDFETNTAIYLGKPGIH